MTMRTGDAASQFGVSTQTIRNWLVEFQEYFDDSNTAHNRINQDGFIIMATIAELSRQGLNYAAIGERLKAGYRTEDLQQFAMPNDYIPVQVAIDGSKQQLELATVRKELEFAQLRITELERERDKFQSKTDSQADEIKRLNEKITALYERLLNDKS